MSRSQKYSPVEYEEKCEDCFHAPHTGKICNRGISTHTGKKPCGCRRNCLKLPSYGEAEKILRKPISKFTLEDIEKL
jgi:hypothetical protein